MAADPAERSALPSPRGRKVVWDVRPRNLDQHSGLREAPEGASTRGSTASLQGVGLARLAATVIVGTRPTLALLEAYCTRLAMRLGREPSGYPIRHARPVERFGIRGTIPLSRDASL